MTETRAERDQRRHQQLTDLHTRLTAGVEDLAHSQAWTRMLDIAARLHAYSPNNVLLIAVQRPDATQVAGYTTWKRLGRQVRKGETGIAILAPCLYRPDPSDSAAAPQPDVRREEPTPTTTVLRGFRVVHVFDITQTDGPELPPEPARLTGSVPQGLWDRLADLTASQGYTLERGPCGTANGYTRFDTHTIRIRGDLDDRHALKTLAHELGHVRAEHDNRFADTYHRRPDCRGIAEVEAESIAYIVMAAHGVETGGYSLPYLAGWSDGQSSVLQATAERVLTVAAAIVHDLDAADSRPGTAALSTPDPTIDESVVSATVPSR